jgi:hypothetical protein
MYIAATKSYRVWVEMPLGSSDSSLSVDINSLIYDGCFLWHLSVLDVNAI